MKNSNNIFIAYKLNTTLVIKYCFVLYHRYMFQLIQTSFRRRFISRHSSYTDNVMQVVRGSAGWFVLWRAWFVSGNMTWSRS